MSNLERDFERVGIAQMDIFNQKLCFPVITSRADWPAVSPAFMPAAAR
jgi:hypothetical protein